MENADFENAKKLAMDFIEDLSDGFDKLADSFAPLNEALDELLADNTLSCDKNDCSRQKFSFGMPRKKQ